MDFVRSHFGKMKLWPVGTLLAHFFSRSGSFVLKLLFYKTHTLASSPCCITNDIKQSSEFKVQLCKNLADFIYTSMDIHGFVAVFSHKICVFVKFSLKHKCFENPGESSLGQTSKNNNRTAFGMMRSRSNRDLDIHIAEVAVTLVFL